MTGCDTVGFTMRDVDDATDPRVAPIADVPSPVLVANPELLIVATAVFPAVQATEVVMSWVLPSEYVPVAVNCWVAPKSIDGRAGATAIATRVGAEVTVNLVEPVTLPDVALMVAVPPANALANPFVPATLLIVATALLLLFHVTDCVRSDFLPLLNVPVAVNCCVAPATKEGFAGVTAMEVNVDPVPLRLVVWGLLPPLSVTVSVPLRKPTMVGVNVTLIVHLLFPPSEEPQLLLWAKSPLTATLLIEIAVV